MSFDKKTREVFFKGAIESSNDDLIEFYKESKYLTYLPTEGYTTYPPLSALGGDGLKDKDYIFQFKSHPYLPFKFGEGELIIRSNEKNDRTVYSEPFIKLYFNNKKHSEAAFNHFIELYTPISTRHRVNNKQVPYTAEFTNDNSGTIQEIGFLLTDWDIGSNAYVLYFILGNDIDNDEEY